MIFRVTKPAEDALDEIWDYVYRTSGSPSIAGNLIEAIVRRFSMLASHPYIGRARDEVLGPGLRSFPVREYIIVYRIDNEQVLILLVIRGDRDIASLLPDNW